MSIVKVKLKNQYQRKDGTRAIVIYINAGKPQYVGTGFHVLPDQFKDGLVRKHRDAAIMNARIEDLRAEIRKCIVPGVGYVPGAQQGQNSANFCEFLERRATHYKKLENLDYMFKLRRAVFDIRAYHGRDVYFSEITPEWVRGLYAYFIQCKNTQNTSMLKIKRLRVWFRAAQKDGATDAKNQFESFSLTYVPVKKDKLTKDEIAALEQLPLVAGSHLFHARNAFLISFYCQGMRFENVATLRQHHIIGDHIVYQMNKGRKHREIFIHPKLRSILENYKDGVPYLMPFIKSEVLGPADLRNKKGAANSMVNRNLKVLAMMAGIKINLSFHTARHSFARLAKKNGVDTNVIKDSLGHSDVKITEAYLEALDDDHINQAVSVVWD